MSNAFCHLLTLKKGMNECKKYMLRTDRPTINPSILKISNGHISGANRPINFMFGSRMGFSGSADRMALFPISPNLPPGPCLGSPWSPWQILDPPLLQQFQQYKKRRFNVNQVHTGFRRILMTHTNSF